MQVRRALEHGLHSGLIKQRSGKFRLGLDRRDYAIFRRFKQIHTEPSGKNSSTLFQVVKVFSYMNNINQR